jgi:hypothetical protein
MQDRNSDQCTLFNTCTITLLYVASSYKRTITGGTKVTGGNTSIAAIAGRRNYYFDGVELSVSQNVMAQNFWLHFVTVVQNFCRYENRNCLQYSAFNH